ncbi:hypothetical protein ACFX2A_024443 [Malus domestica]
MDSQEILLKNLVMKVKQELFSPDVDLVSLVPPSPYDIAWLSMIPNPHRGSDEPLFKGCLDWVLQHQTTRGFWGDNDHFPTLESLTSTLACIVFPAMVELAENKGLHVHFSPGSTALVEQVFQKRSKIFQMHRYI